MKVSKLLAFVAMFAFSFSSFATNVAKGIYSNDADGIRQCLADLSAGTAVGYMPTLDSPITSKRFEIKKVGSGGACLIKARVTGDDGKGTQVATVSVTEGFEYGVFGKELRMKVCSNQFGNILFPKAKVAEKQPEPAPVPVASAAPATQVNVVQVVNVEQPSPAPAPASSTNSCNTGKCETFVTKTRTPRTDGKCVTETNIGYLIQVGKDGGSTQLVAMLVDANIKPITGGKVVKVGQFNVSGDCDKDQASLVKEWDKTRAELGLPSICTLS